MNKDTSTARYDWTVYIYKRDARCKTGSRTVSTTVWRDRSEASIQREVDNIRSMWAASDGYLVMYASPQLPLPTWATLPCNIG